ncbi:hypothetical protein M0804_012046 [Polistes exclamans]|nr:hypothetical protein M0804_012046 [Polistes exclamans]
MVEGFCTDDKLDIEVSIDFIANRLGCQLIVFKSKHRVASSEMVSDVSGCCKSQESTKKDETYIDVNGVDFADSYRKPPGHLLCHLTTKDSFGFALSRSVETHQGLSCMADAIASADRKANQHCLLAWLHTWLYGYLGN